MSDVRKETGFARSFDGTKIYYEVRGEGQPIIMAYGIGCLINHWIHQYKYFSQKYQTIVFDYRGHHKSSLPESREHLNVDAFALDVKAILDHLQITKCSMWGHSFGVQVLTRAYDLFPHYFSNLVYINGFVTNPIKGMFGNDLANSLFNVVKNGYGVMPQTISYFWKQAVNNPVAIQLSALAGGFNLQLTHLKDIEIYARGVASMNLDAFIHMFESMMNYDGLPVLERIEAPTLIIAGTKDSVTPENFQIQMHEKIKGSQYLMVPYGSHCTQLDMPELVNLRIDKFLKEKSYI